MHRRPPNHALRAIPGLPAPGRRGPRWRVAALGRGPGEGRRGGRWGGEGRQLARRGRWSLWRPGGRAVEMRDARGRHTREAGGPSARREPRGRGRGLLMGGVSGPAPSMGIARGEAPSVGGGLIGPSVFASSLGGLAGGAGGHLPGGTGAGASGGGQSRQSPPLQDHQGGGPLDGEGDMAPSTGGGGPGTGPSPGGAGARAFNGGQIFRGGILGRRRRGYGGGG